MTERRSDTLAALAPETSLGDLSQALPSGVLLVDSQGDLAGADERALALFGCRDAPELARRLAEAPERSLPAAGRAGRLPLGADGRDLWCESRPLAGGTGGTVLLVRDAAGLAETTADLRLAAFTRTLAAVAPAVAHDLRAPINAMVFNIEILKETVTAAPALDATVRQRLLRYVGVLKEELARLHRGMEHLIAHISSRGDRPDTFDLRDAVEELAALLVPQARKVQVQVHSSLPEEPVAITANRYQLRQALLPVGLAALAGVARAGALEIDLAVEDGRAALVLSGPPGAELPSLDFTLAQGPGAGGGAGSVGVVRLYHARAILAEQGGSLTVTPEDAAAGGGRSFEVEWPVSGKE
jgi:signal transduction histidine kinase